MIFDRIDEMIEKIQDHERQRDTQMMSIGICINHLVKRGVLTDGIVLGSNIWQLPANSDSMTDALGIVYQPAVIASQSLGIVKWKALDYLQSRDNNSLEDKASLLFIPYTNCNRFERGLVLRDLEQLITEIRERCI